MYEKPALNVVGVASDLIQGVAGEFLDPDNITPKVTPCSSKLEEE